MSTQPLADGGTAVATRPAERLHEPGDHDRLSHYVPKGELEAAILEGRPTTALCGKTWVPTHDPEAFPVCPECRDRWEAMGDE